MSFSLLKTKESCRATSQQVDGRKEKVKGCFRSLSHPANKNLPDGDDLVMGVEDTVDGIIEDFTRSCKRKR
ncbi:hypothetical protein TNCV_5030051 [Trichonephila clavipes]|nr:hypothetical protein TNCV_5030051 [Trichonephila clavipes]